MIQDAGSVLYLQTSQENGHAVTSQSEAKMHVPMKIGGFTDFMCALEHVETVSKAEPDHRCDCIQASGY